MATETNQRSTTANTVPEPITAKAPADTPVNVQQQPQVDVAAFEVVNTTQALEDVLLQSDPDDEQTLHNILYDQLDYEFESLNIEHSPPPAAIEVEIEITQPIEPTGSISIDQDTPRSTLGIYRIPKTGGNITGHVGPAG